MDECVDVLLDYDNKKWECYMCGRDEDWEFLPSGYINNMHPLCEKCADEVLVDKGHRQHHQLSYHRDIGDIILVI